jgi:hypothetical protein
VASHAGLHRFEQRPTPYLGHGAVHLLPIVPRDQLWERTIDRVTEATEALTLRSTYRSAIPPAGGFDLSARARAALVRGFERNRGGRPPPPPAATTAARCSLGAVRRESAARKKHEQREGKRGREERHTAAGEPAESASPNESSAPPSTVAPPDEARQLTRLSRSGEWPAWIFV